MTFSKSALALAAATLLTAQSAAAVPRAAAPVAESEQLGESPAAMPFLAVFAVFLAVGLVILLTDDDDSPESP